MPWYWEAVPCSHRKLGRINLEEIITLMPEYKEMMTNMEAYSKDLRDNLETIQVEPEHQVQRFPEKQSDLLGGNPPTEGERIDRPAKTVCKSSTRAHRKTCRKRRRSLTDPIVAKAQEAVKKVAQRELYVAVFNTTIPSMVYYDEAAMTDLSTEVKAELGIQ